jgi:HAD superfamily hydrolase (TIGR01509 family)
MTPRPCAVIFDMDGTLTHDAHDYDRIRAELGLGREPILEAVSRMTGDERRRAEEVLHRHEAAAAADSALQPNAERVLRALRAAGIPVALMTRNSRRSVETLLARHGLAFDHIRTREDGPFKPAPDPVLDICRALGVPPGDAWVVGDYRYDILCGRAAGATTVGLQSGPQRPEWADEADFVIGDLMELLDCMAGRGVRVQPPEG